LRDADGKQVSYRRLHLVFADGRLKERQVVEMPGGKVHFRETLAADGVRWFDKDGKERGAQKAKLAAAQAPRLTANLKDIVVLPLPYRTPEHIRAGLERDKKNLQQRPAEEALPLFAAYVGSRKADDALQLYRQVFHARDQRHLGLYVLLA